MTDPILDPAAVATAMVAMDMLPHPAELFLIRQGLENGLMPFGLDPVEPSDMAFLANTASDWARVGLEDAGILDRLSEMGPPRPDRHIPLGIRKAYYQAHSLCISMSEDELKGLVRQLRKILKGLNTGSLVRQGQYEARDQLRGLIFAAGDVSKELKLVREMLMAGTSPKILATELQVFKKYDKLSFDQKIRLRAIARILMSYERHGSILAAELAGDDDSAKAEDTPAIDEDDAE